MEKSKLMRNTGLVVGGIALLSVVDFLNARVLAPLSPFYQERGAVVQAEPETLNSVTGYEERNQQTLSLDSDKGLGAALTPAVQDMIGETASKKEVAKNPTDEAIDEKSNKVMGYLTGEHNTKDMIADTSMSDGEKRLLMSLMSVSKLRKIAKTGNTTAQNQLGLKYYNDEDDAKNALYWFMEAANGGLDVSLTNAASILSSEQIPKSAKDGAVTWMRAQADQGRTPAQFVIGKFYKDGQYGFPEDKAIGFAWVEKAAKNGHGEAQMEIGFAKMLGNDIPEDKAGGIDWLKKSAAQGNARGEYWLADAYRDGDFVAQDDSSALMWFERAYNAGHSGAALQMVFIYSDEDSLEQDNDKLRKWVEIMIAKDGSSVGYEYAGDMYLEGRGYPQNDAKAFENYKIASEKDNGTAQYKMAIMMLEGRGTAQDKQLAIEWLKTAAKNYSYKAGKKLEALGVTVE